MNMPLYIHLSSNRVKRAVMRENQFSNFPVGYDEN